MVGTGVHVCVCAGDHCIPSLDVLGLPTKSNLFENSFTTAGCVAEASRSTVTWTHFRATESHRIDCIARAKFSKW